MSFVCFVGSNYLIGVDGGGTKTELILVDASTGEIVARHTAPGCNPSHAGAENARAIITDALATLLAHSALRTPPSAISTTHLYMAGSPAFWSEFAASLQNHGRVIAAQDSLPVLELATAGAPGLVLHAGTGSFVAARGLDGAIHYAGGLGWKFGDPGSGFDLGRRAIAHALLELQEWTPPTELSAALTAHTGRAGAVANTRYFYQDADANARIAAFAPRVLELAEQGCHPAQAALAATLAEFVAQARLVTDKLFGDAAVPCGLSGAILNNPASVYALRALAENAAWNVEYRFITEPPIEGVRRLLLA